MTTSSVATGRSTPSTANLNTLEVIFRKRPGLEKQLQDLLFHLLENRPAKPMVFIRDYFLTAQKATTVRKAYVLLELSNPKHPRFKQNIRKAYNLLLAKSGNKAGLSLSVFRKLISILGDDFKIDPFLPGTFMKFQKKLLGEVVPFNLFLELLTECFSHRKFVEDCEPLYIGSLQIKDSSSGEQEIDQIKLVALLHSFVLRKRGMDLTDKEIHEKFRVEKFLESECTLGDFAWYIHNSLNKI